MNDSIPQELLDSLTRVKMPTGMSFREAESTQEINGVSVPVFRCDVLVLGSGAAGLRAAVELKRAGKDVVVASSSFFGGTSACSGSDKQTIHSSGTSNRGDDFVQLGQDIGAGGCMDKDTAYIEGVGSTGAFSTLQYMGLPLPQDRFGAVLRYQTDHDDVGRATSCGPRTSRLMVKVLCEEAIRLGVPFVRSTGVKILTHEENGETICSGVIAISSKDKTNDYGLQAILCDQLVLATGGPGELYRDSVYPRNCFGSLGMALEVGVKAANLTESQFGIGTERDAFPWNLSGTYVQVMPYIYSVDAEGNEHNFLADYYRTTAELASNVFRKGYQWPFHADRMLNYGSSLVDIAIWQERNKGRAVYMDFNRNPESVPGDKPFSLDDLDQDVYDYLANNNGLQAQPIDRLLSLNPLSIELYKMHGTDINTTPLAFAVNNQHMNGGLDVDIWGRTSLKGCYAIGEVAGTHGVTRPGGAALNAGQVFGKRCVDHISNVASSTSKAAIDISLYESTIAQALTLLDDAVNNETGVSLDEIRDDVQARMSDKASFICRQDIVTDAYAEARALNQRIREQGVQLSSAGNAVDVFRWQQTALTSEAVLAALDSYLKAGGGSRGARAVCSNEGSLVPQTIKGNLEEFRFIEERLEDREQKLLVRFNAEDHDFEISSVALREMEDPATIFFEKNWGSYLRADIYGNDYSSPE